MAIKIETRILNLGGMRADKVKEGTFILYDGLVAEVTGGSFQDPGVHLHLKAHTPGNMGWEHTLKVSREHSLHVIKTVSIRTEDN